ncbi:MAG: hypothetical protein RLZZ282_1810 [Verrucomicrobiota bacterium]|jgi:hypothetical protein
MNFDPYDSAAWRSFNMLDDEESAVFDEAMHHDPVLRSASREMERLSAAIAAATAVPIDPKPGQLERLHARLGFRPAHPPYFWLGISGWATASVLAVFLILHLTGIIDAQRSEPSTTAQLATEPNATPTHGELAPILPSTALTGDGTPAKSTTKVETKRLNQEIEVLRDNLEKFQHRDRVLFEVVPGMALPIVMSMNPPGVPLEDSATQVKNEGHSPLTALLGNVLTELTGAPAATSPTIVRSAGADALPNHPTAIPVYDAARDVGTLVVSQLPPADVGDVYNLWVTTQAGGTPIYVGTLPESSSQGTDSFDFSLGSTMVLPSGFILTIDPQDAPAAPTSANTVLQGPPMPTR